MGSELIGQVILDQYRVDVFVEAGGMGVVYRVWDLARSAPLAMKVLHEDFNDDPSIFKMFKREADALTNLTHPHIVPFYGFFQTPDYAFFLERYIDGPSLKRTLHERKGKPLPLPEALAVFKALSSALGYAHLKGLVHCDIKPGNVLLDQGGNIYLTDFGIARHPSSTTTIATAGTPAYMAPEQIRGEAVTPATDVYALGALLFEMLTGRRPFLGNEPESEELGPSTDQRIYYAHLHIPPVSPDRLNSEVPESLSQVILRALEKDPARRYPGTQELLQAVCQALVIMPNDIPDRLSTGIPAGPALPSRPSAQILTGPTITFPPQPKSWLKSNLPLLLLSGGAAGCLLLIALVWIGSSLFRNQPRVNGTQNTPAGQTQPVTASTTRASTRTSVTPALTQPAAVETAQPTVTADLVAASTPTAAPVEFNAPLYEPIPGCAASHIHKKDWAMITVDEGRVAVRSTPDTHPSDNKVGYAEPGELIYIADGPECNYGWLLWQVHTITGVEGWAPETDGKRFFLEPFPSWEACPFAPLSLLHKGDKAQVTQFPPVSNNVRASPGVNGEKVGVIESGEALVVLDGPKCVDGYVWWKILTKSGLEGWTAEGNKEEYFLVPVPSQRR